MTFKNFVKEETFKSVSESDKLIIIHKSKPLIWRKMLIMLIRELDKKWIKEERRISEEHLETWHKMNILIQFLNHMSS